MNKRRHAKPIIAIQVVFLFFCSCQLWAQDKYSPLHVGDKMPDYVLHNLINYPKKVAKVSDFGGKLLIFDLWGTGCKSCVESWPKLLDLQKEFDGEIQILLLNTYEDEIVVRKVIERQRKIRSVDMTLPMICRDTVLGQKLFKHNGVPHVVWIDKTGIVRSISGGTAVNSENIQDLLNNEPVSMQQKTDIQLKVNWNTPLFDRGNGGDGSSVITRSILAKYVDGIVAGFGINQTSTGIYAGGASIRRLYAIAYDDRVNVFMAKRFYGLEQSRIVLEVQNPSKFEHHVNSKGENENLYMYQLLTAKSSRKKLQEMMQLDLEKYFGLAVSWEIRRVKCLVLTAEDTSLISYRSGKKKFAVLEKDKVQINNVTTDAFIDYLKCATDYYKSPYPILNETGMKGPVGGIEFERDFDVANHEDLDRALRNFKMHFTIQDRQINVLVIRPPQGWKSPAFMNDIMDGVDN